MKNVIVTGSTSGLGYEIVKAFGVKPYVDEVRVYGIAEHRSEIDMPPNYEETFLCDISDPAEVEHWLRGPAIGFPVDILINNAGVNYIDWMQDIDVQDWDRVMNTNARGIWLVTKALLQNMKAAIDPTIMNVVSNAMHIPMTHSIAYNASKGAAGIMTRQMARELQKEHGICVFGICPNKMAGTKMSRYIEGRVEDLRGWTSEQAEEYQLKALLSGKETEPSQIAELVVWLLSSPRRHKYLTGCLLELGL